MKRFSSFSCNIKPKKKIILQLDLQSVATPFCISQLLMCMLLVDSPSCRVVYLQSFFFFFFQCVYLIVVLKPPSCNAGIPLLMNLTMNKTEEKK